jgi:N utilization substance protein A
MRKPLINKVKQNKQDKGNYMTVKLATDNIRTMAMFENITGVQPKDCIINDEEVYFVVEKERMGKAIGKKGANMKNLRRVLSNRHVKIFACNGDLEGTLKSMVPNIKKIEIKEDSVIISVPRNEKVAVIGRNGRNINAIREILKRRFAVRELKLR